jgi:hypothetical protein
MFIKIYRCMIVLLALGSVLSMSTMKASAHKQPQDTPTLPVLPTLPISTGKEIVLAKQLEPEKPTLLLFVKGNSTLEKQFLANMQKMVAGRPVALRVVSLTKGDEPITKQFNIKETPTVVVFDRRGRETGRSSEASEIQKLAIKASRVARIDWMDEGPAFEEFKKNMPGLRSPNQLPEIMRTMSLEPDIMMAVQSVAGKMHFSDGALPRRQKEMIAAYVSALNKCKY